MNLYCERNELYDALQKAIVAVSPKPIYPILECFKLSTEDNMLSVYASDNNVFIKSQCDAQVFEQGDIAINARLFLDAIRAFPNCKLKITKDNKNGLLIEGGGSRFEARAMDAEDFPIMRSFIHSPSLHMPQNLLKSMIKHVSFSVSTDETRKILTGVMFELTNDEVILVGLDGFRLSMQRYKHDYINGNFNPFKIVIPAKTLNDIAHMLRDEENAQLSIHADNSNVMFSFDKTCIICAIIGGNYPNFINVIPQQFKLRVDLLRSKLQSALDFALILSRAGNVNTVKLDITKDKINISSKNETAGTENPVECSIEGDELSIHFNCKYLSEIIKNMDSENISLFFNNQYDACVIRPKDDENSTYLLMSVRV